MMRIKKSRGITLMELLVASGLVGVILLTLTVGYSFVSRQIVTALKLKNLYLQIDYAMEHIALHCISAAKIDTASFFTPGVDNTRNSIEMEGEDDVFIITPNNLTDNAWYEYYKNADGNIMFKRDKDGVITEEVLVDKEFSPEIEFRYTAGTEPNFMTVTIAGRAAGQPVSKSRGIRFWFVDIVK